jgi:hypothetical protein
MILDQFEIREILSFNNPVLNLIISNNTKLYIFFNKKC